MSQREESDSVLAGKFPFHQVRFNEAGLKAGAKCNQSSFIRTGIVETRLIN